MKHRIIPCLSYDNCKEAIKWLCDAFGFEVKASYEHEGRVMHAELVFKGNMIMVGDTNTGSPFSKLVTQPNDVGGKETQTPYVVLDADEIDAHYANVKSKGGKIAMELEEQSYGGKNYGCYDLEGHLWSFGSYDPWAEQTA